MDDGLSGAQLLLPQPALSGAPRVDAAKKDPSDSFLALFREEPEPVEPVDASSAPGVSSDEEAAKGMSAFSQELARLEEERLRLEREKERLLAPAAAAPPPVALERGDSIVVRERPSMVSPRRQARPRELVVVADAGEMCRGLF